MSKGDQTVIEVFFEDWGLVDYKEAWEQQEAIFKDHVQRKLRGLRTRNTLIFSEHPHVFTLGKSGNRANLLISDAQLKMINASFYNVDRGGDITYHGPGQIVGYPILDLELFHLTLKEYIYKLEEVIIRLLGESFGLQSGRLKGATGVWLGQGASERKICAIGTRSSRHITMHGFAFNVSTDLSYFGYIHPCGFTNRSVTSIEKETGNKQNVEQIKEILADYFMLVFHAHPRKSAD